MNLRGTQELLWRLISAPEGVATALQDDPDDAALLAALLAAGVASTPQLSAARRLDVYALAYFARIHDALAEDFSDLARQLGKATFHDLVTSYLAICPPERPSLRDVGERLPAFLAHGVGGEPFRRRAPWAAELARLEWVQADLFDAPDCELATRADFDTLPPEAWSQAPLRLIPAMALLAFEWPVHRFCESWPGNADGPTPGEPEPSEILVWRAYETVRYRPIETSEAEALALIATTETCFGEVCEFCEQAELAARPGDDSSEPEASTTAAATTAASWLSRWLADGLLASAPQQQA